MRKTDEYNVKVRMYSENRKNVRKKKKKSRPSEETNKKCLFGQILHYYTIV